ncbi:MAG TPA: septum formation initiator family protein [Thermoanaerobaculia bacterium]|nr:septum formation initiator family protein [Thermoanaerobaculia bacterium]
MTQSEAPRRSVGYRPVLGAAVVLFLVLLGLASLKSWRDLEAARGRERRLETEIHETEVRIEQLQGRIARLRSDPGSLERLAREDLGMVRPGDVVIVLPDNADGRPLTLPSRAVPQSVSVAEVPTATAVSTAEPSAALATESSAASLEDVTPEAASAGSPPPASPAPLAPAPPVL